MKSAPWLLLIRVCALVALAASGALFADYSGTAPTYCVAGSGCAAVRHAGWGYVPIPGFFIPVPAVGAVAFSLLIAFSLLPDPRRRVALTSLAALFAGLVSVGLLVIQGLVIGAFCTLCVTVDSAALVAAVAGGALLLQKPAEHFEPLRNWAWTALAALFFLAPWYWPKARPAPDVPPSIQKLYAPGKINVVEFIDFECPFCRRLHPTLKKVEKEYAGRVHLVRLNMPLSQHENAFDGALSYVCAEEQNKAEEMADLLFAMEPLSARGARQAAQKLELDLRKYDRCMGAKAARDRVENDMNTVRSAGMDGLPTTYVGNAVIIGAQSEDMFRSAFERAARGAGQRGAPLPIYLLVAFGAAAGIAIGGRRRPAE